MRFLFLVSIVLFVGACSHHKNHSHGDGHEHTKTSSEKSSCGCSTAVESHKSGECKECAAEESSHNNTTNAGTPQAQKNCTGDCKTKIKERGCCSEGKSCSTSSVADESETCPIESPLENNARLLKNISRAEFAKIYSENKEKIGETCSAPAMKYCNKATKDLNVTEAEVTCLWTKVFRVSRERLPELDGTPCASMIKSFAKNR